METKTIIWGHQPPVMRTLGSFVPRMEIYFIDEASLDMPDLDYLFAGAWFTNQNRS